MFLKVRYENIVKEYYKVLEAIVNYLDNDHRLYFQITLNSDVIFYIPIYDTSEKAYYISFVPSNGCLEFAKKNKLKIRLLHIAQPGGRIYRVDELAETPTSLLLNIQSVENIITKYADILEKNYALRFLTNLSKLCNSIRGELLGTCRVRRNKHVIDVNDKIINLLSKFILLMKILV